MPTGKGYGSGGKRGARAAGKAGKKKKAAAMKAKAKKSPSDDAKRIKDRQEYEKKGGMRRGSK